MNNLWIDFIRNTGECHFFTNIFSNDTCTISPICKYSFFSNINTFQQVNRNFSPPVKINDKSSIFSLTRALILVFLPPRLTPIAWLPWTLRAPKDFAIGRINLNENRFAWVQFSKDIDKNASFAPLSEFVINAVPVAIAKRQIAPGCTSSHYPKDCIECSIIVQWRSAGCFLLW